MSQGSPFRISGLDGITFSVVVVFLDPEASPAVET